MDYQTAITTAKAGTPVRRSSWTAGKTITKITDGSTNIIGTVQTITTNVPYVATQEDMFADDWTT